MQPWHTPFPISNQSVVPCRVLTVAFHLHTDFSGDRSGDLVFPSLRIFQFAVIHTVKGLGIVDKVELDIFLELSCFFDDPTDVGNLISGSSAFSKSSLNIWKFTVHVLLKPTLENFEHYFASVWDECNCAVVWAFFGIAFLWDRNENWPFLVLWPPLSFPNLLAYWMQHFNSIIFQTQGTFLGGIQHSPVDGCPAVSCNSGVLAGEDERTVLLLRILMMSKW